MADYILLSNSAGNSIKLNLVNEFSLSLTSDNIPLPLAGRESSDVSVFNLSGVSGNYSFDFKLIDDGTDKSNGSNIVTIKQQFQYLTKTVFTGKIEEQYTIIIDNFLFAITLNCLINELTLRPNKSNPSYIPGTVRVIEGSNPLVLGDL